MLEGQTSSSSSSMRACSSLICFCSLPTKDCSSSSLAVRDESSLSLRWMVCSSSFLFLSRSATASCVSFRSPSTFLFAFSTSALKGFNVSHERLFVVQQYFYIEKCPFWKNEANNKDPQTTARVLWSLKLILPWFLLTFEGIFEFIEGLFEFELDFVEMVDFVLGSLELFGGLLINLALVLLLLIQFVNELILMGNLVVQVSDLMVLRGFVLLGFLEIQFEVLDILLQSRDLLFEFLLILEEVVPCILLFLEPVGEVLQCKNKYEMNRHRCHFNFNQPQY